MATYGPATESVPVRVQRGEETLALTLFPELVCAFSVRVAIGGELNAYADGTS